MGREAKNIEGRQERVSDLDGHQHRCPTCGSPVWVHSSGEGTNSYVPMEPEVQLILRARRGGAGLVTISYLDDADRPLCAVVVVDGGAETEDVIRAIEPVEAAWR